ncbi:MAG: type IV pilus assembly protein PilM [Candidatus Omnitrophica bacterium]|nr:type IV pilus assembly protein PilM [Candidatus Omnitrophota bacterium]
MAETPFGKTGHGPSAKKIVGLDIGSSFVKAVEVSGGISPSLISLGMKKVRGASRIEMAETVTRLVEESKFSAKEANISVSGPFVVARFVTMPKMKDDELKSAVRFEAEKVVPFNISECVVDFQVLRTDKAGSKTDLILVAAKRDMIEDRIKAAEASGLSVAAVDVDSLALAGSFSRNKADAAADKSFAILNIGARFTNLAIVREGTAYFIRDLAFGGNEFSAAISKVLGVDNAASDKIKESPHDKRQSIVDAVKPVVNNLLDEVKLSFNYYENQNGRGVDEIYISGGSSGLAGLEDLFQEYFGVRPFAWDPLAFLDKSASGIDAKLLEGSKGSYGVAAGLALR